MHRKTRVYLVRILSVPDIWSVLAYIPSAMDQVLI